ncbi:MAG: hypothetical protein ACRDFA_04500 [bacterium]
MSVRAVAVRNGPRAFPVPASAVRATGSARVVRAARRARVYTHAVPRAAWVQFHDDRRLVGFKLILLGLLALAAMALEVPF